MGQIAAFAFRYKKSYRLRMTKSPIETRLMNRAIGYLGRYAASQHRLSEVLGRFALRKLDKHDPDKIAVAISATVTRCRALGYLDDDAFALSQARSLRRQGRSQLGIRKRLRQHKIDEMIINAALDAADQHEANSELLAACVFARRRRFGPFYRRQYYDANDREAVIQRQLGSMARAGFGMAISNKVIRLENMDAGEMLIGQLEQGEDPTI